MKRLDDLPLKHRIFLAIVTVAVVLLALMIINRFVGEEAQAQTKYCVASQQREEIRQMTFKGIDEGFVGKVSHLFDIWVSDPHEQPKRASVGMDQAISAYLRARANAEKWEPPLCQ